MHRRLKYKSNLHTLRRPCEMNFGERETGSFHHIYCTQEPYEIVHPLQILWTNYSFPTAHLIKNTTEKKVWRAKLKCRHSAGRWWTFDGLTGPDDDENSFE